MCVSVGLLSCGHNVVLILWIFFLQKLRFIGHTKMPDKGKKKKNGKSNGNGKNGNGGGAGAKGKSKPGKKSSRGGSKRSANKTGFSMDAFSEEAMENAYYTCHNIMDVLHCRGFPWPEAQKKKKKGKK